MIRRILLATAILGAAIFWANCGFSAHIPAPNPNTFFAGCFEGMPADNPKPLKIVLEADSSEPYILKGCLQFSADQASVSGQVEDSDRNRAQLTVMPTAGPTSYTILVIRQPTGDFNAATIDVSDVMGAPFKSAVNLSKCTQSCPDLMIPVPFMPDGGPP
jgi:hypothetical protein